jgi:hypothetical protein
VCHLDISVLWGRIVFVCRVYGGSLFLLILGTVGLEIREYGLRDLSR